MTTYFYEVILTDFDIACIQAAMKFSKNYYDLSEKINFLMSERHYQYGYLDDIKKVSNKLDIIRLNKKEEYQTVFDEHEYIIIYNCFEDTCNESYQQDYKSFHNLLEYEEWDKILNKDLSISELKSIFNSINAKIKTSSKLNSYSTFTKNLNDIK